MKYYVGVKNGRTIIAHCLIYRTNPTTTSHPDGHLFAWGPYATRAEAEERAMYQNYAIDNDRKLPAPQWPRDFATHYTLPG